MGMGFGQTGADLEKAGEALGFKSSSYDGGISGIYEIKKIILSRCLLEVSIKKEIAKKSNDQNLYKSTTSALEMLKNNCFDNTNNAWNWNLGVPSFSVICKDLIDANIVKKDLIINYLGSLCVLSI